MREKGPVVDAWVIKPEERRAYRGTLPAPFVRGVRRKISDEKPIKFPQGIPIEFLGDAPSVMEPDDIYIKLN